MSEKEYKPKYTPTEIITMFETAVSKEMNAKPKWLTGDNTDWVLSRTVESKFEDYGISDAVVHKLILKGCSKKTAGQEVVLSFKENPSYVQNYFDKNTIELIGYTDIPEDDFGREMRDAFEAPFSTTDISVNRKQIIQRGIEDVHTDVYSVANPIDVDGCYVESNNPVARLALFESSEYINLSYVFVPTMYEDWLMNNYSVTSIVDAFDFPYGRVAKQMGLDWVPDNADCLRFYKADPLDNTSESVIIGVDKLDSDNIRVYNPYVRDSNNEAVFTRLCVNQSEELLSELVRGFETEKGTLTPAQRQSIVDVSYMNDDDTDFQYITSVPEGLKGTDTIQVDVHEFLEDSKSLYVTKVQLTDKESFFRVREAFDVNNVPEKIDSYGTFDSLIDFKRAFEEGLKPKVVQVGAKKEKEEPVIEDDSMELE